MKLRSKKGFTLIELIIVIAILGIIALIAVPNLAGIRQRSQVSADKRTAEQIGKAVRIWATDIDAAGSEARNIPTGVVRYDVEKIDGNTSTELKNLCPDYISSGYTAKSFANEAGTFYVSSFGAGTNNANQKIYVGIDTPKASTTLGEPATLAAPTNASVVDYAGGTYGWAYIEQ